MAATIKAISIEGYKSIRRLDGFELRPLNVLVGANGAGKSNFVSLFRLLRELIEQRLQLAVELTGGADSLLHLGPKITSSIKGGFRFGENAYEFTLVPTADNRLTFADERAVFYNGNVGFPKPLGSGQTESRLKDRKDDSGATATHGPAHYVYDAISNWVVYHFHDTSETAPMRRWGPINDNERLRPDASNLAAYLMRLSTTSPVAYGRIRDVVRLAAPFFDDFKLRPVPSSPEMTQLEWTQKGANYFFRPSQLSDGTLRFICLATALLQPSLPFTVLFDEPELGLHPYALTLLAGMVQQATGKYRQVILSTQSASLLNLFTPADVVVVERSNGQSTFRRLGDDDLTEWLTEYGLGDLWQKNVFGGRPGSESVLPAGSK